MLLPHHLKLKVVFNFFFLGERKKERWNYRSIWFWKDYRVRFTWVTTAVSNSNRSQNIRFLHSIDAWTPHSPHTNKQATSLGSHSISSHFHHLSTFPPPDHVKVQFFSVQYWHSLFINKTHFIFALQSLYHQCVCLNLCKNRFCAVHPFDNKPQWVHNRINLQNPQNRQAKASKVHRQMLQDRLLCLPTWPWLKWSKKSSHLCLN